MQVELSDRETRRNAPSAVLQSRSGSLTTADRLSPCERFVRLLWVRR